MILQLLICFIAIFPLSNSLHTFRDCPDIYQCVCDRLDGFGYSCFFKLSFYINNGTILNLDCKLRKEGFYKPYIPPDEPDMNIEYVHFRGCEYPADYQNNFTDTMKQLQINSTKSLVVSFGTFGELSRNDFEGLENIEKLEITYSKFIRDLPEDLIHDLKKLEMIDLRFNNLTIPQNFFLESKQLRTIVIAGNHLPENTTGFLKNQKKLRAIKLEMKKFDPKIFEHCRNLEQIDISFIEDSSIPTDIFRNLPILKILYLHGERIKTLPFGLLDDNRKLELVNFKKNFHLSKIPDYFLAGKIDLKSATLKKCNLTTLPNHLFDKSNSLVNIDLSYNRLRELPTDLLRGKSLLRHLDLSNNRLVHLPYEFFEDLHELENLKLSNNFLQLTSDNFDALINLVVLNLSNNSMKSLNASCENLNYLNDLDLSFNELTSLEDPSDNDTSIFNDLINLEKLNLQRNNISMIPRDWKYKLLNLKELNLSYNKFTKLQYEDFKFKQKEIKINLDNNLIRSIDMSDAEFKSGTSLRIQISLNNNPFHCDCNSFDLYRYNAKYSDFTTVSELYLKADQLFCHSPGGLVNTSVDTIISEEFTCNYSGKFCPKIAICHQNLDTLMMNMSKKGLVEVPDIRSFEDERNIKFNNTFVYLQENYIKKMPKPGMGYEEVYLLNFSHNMIDKVEWIPRKVQVLQLDNNKLTHLDDEILFSLGNISLVNISLHNNPWSCDCSTVGLIKFIKYNIEKFEEKHLKQITCQGTNQSLVNLSKDYLCPPDTNIIITSISLAAIFCLIMAASIFFCIFYKTEIMVWLFARQWCMWFVTEKEVDKDKIYDAFISYSHKDEEFVIPELIEKLEQEPNPYKLCLHFRNWLPGEFISRNITKSIAESRRTIIILSENFLESEWGKLEFRVAHQKAFEENRARIIVILLGKIATDELDHEMTAYLKTNTYLKWDDPWFWDKLRYSLPHSYVEKNLNTSEPTGDVANDSRNEVMIPLVTLSNVNSQMAKQDTA